MKTIYSIKSISSAIRMILVVAAFISAPQLYAQTETPDTILHITGSNKLIVTENPTGTLVEVRDIEKGDELVASVFTEYAAESSVRSSLREGSLGDWWYNRNLLNVDDSYNSHWGVSIDGLCLGLTNAVDQSPERGLQWSKSFEISWLSCLNVYYEFSRSKVSLGLGFDWRNYKVTTGDKALVANDSKGIEWGAYPEGSRGRFSRLKVFSLQLPLLYEYSIPKSSLSLKAGPIFNFNTYASLKSAWDDENGNRHELFTKEIDPRRFTVDFFACISFCRALGIYARYSPMKVMDAPTTLNFQPLTIGLTLGI